MDEPLIELTPEWLEFQNLLNEARAKGASVSSENKVTIDTLEKTITNQERKDKKPKKEEKEEKEDELEEDNCPSINR